MRIQFNEKNNSNLEEDEIYLELQYCSKNKEVQHLIEYINNYNIGRNSTVVVVTDDYAVIEINTKDIIMFYSDKKNNYCKVKDKSYRIKSRLYELEKEYTDFIRVSKSCIVNIKHVEKFDISESGKIVVRLDDLSEQIVSRRRSSNIMKYLEERMI